MAHSKKARTFPKDLTTGIAAPQVLNALINRKKTSKDRVRKAFEAARLQLQKMLSNADPVQLNVDVYMLASEVSREGP